MTKITEIMTDDPTTIDVRDPLSDALRALDSAPYHHLVVTENEMPVGMVSSTDIFRLLHELDTEGDGSFSDLIDELYTIEDAMSTNLRSVPVTGTVKDAAIALSDGSFHSVAVVNGGLLVGIVTTTDLARYLAAHER
jgi:CBS domain-containing protein